MDANVKSIKIGLCGLGTVGSGVFNLLAAQYDLLAARIGCPVELIEVGARRDNPACDLHQTVVKRDIFALLDNPDIDIIVELIGGTTVAKDLVSQAIAKGKHVVTANKALIAEFGNTLFAQAQAQGVTLAYEAAVAGGIPIIKALREGLAANRIDWLAGIINGTGNFILTEMAKGQRDFAEVLQEAQAKGYAEADPTFDVEGIDAAHKLAILASLAFAMPLTCDKVYAEGISSLANRDIDYAAKLGYRIKHLGIARQSAQGVELRVHPTLIPAKHLLANVDGVMNAIVVKGDSVGPTLYYGAGAGAEPTASAVVADIVDIARQLTANAANTIPPLGATAVASPKLLPITAVTTAYYLRLRVEDKPGVLSDITAVLSRAGISVEAMHQHEPEAQDTHAEIVLITNKVKEAELMAAVAEIEAMPPIQDAVNIIRVETLA